MSEKVLYNSTSWVSSAFLIYSAISVEITSLNALLSYVCSSFCSAFNSANCVSSSVILSNLLLSSVTALLIFVEIESSIPY